MLRFYWAVIFDNMFYSTGPVLNESLIDEKCMTRMSLLSDQNAWREKLGSEAERFGADWGSSDISWSQMDRVIIVNSISNQHLCEKIFGGPSIMVARPLTTESLKDLGCLLQSLLEKEELSKIAEDGDAKREKKRL